MTQEIHFLAPLPAIRKRTRIAKMVPVLKELGYRINFYGWERIPGEAKEFESDEEGVLESSILQGGGYASGKARALYPLWMAKVFWQTLRIGRGQLLFCLGWETAFPALLAARFTGSKVVFDDADRFSMIVRLPNLAGRLLISLERWASRYSEMHIVPGFSRYEWKHDKMFVLRNSPLEADLLAARRVAQPRPEADIVLYANGWVGETRGAPIFLKLIELSQKRDLNLKMVIAGRIDGVSAPQLISHPQTIYLGELGQRDALAWYDACDAVLTYYDPSVPINRKAESNKWGDAIFFDCPIIVNSEVETAARLVDAGAAISVPYSDVEGLLDLIQDISPKGPLRTRTQDAVSRLKKEYPVFDQQFKGIFSHLTNKEQK